MGKRAAKRKTSISPSLSAAEPLPVCEFSLSNYEPYRILDIQQSLEDASNFSFVIVFRSLADMSSRKNFKFNSLSFLTERYRLWLLVFFKKNLKDLSAIKKMKTWALMRLQLLKEYCEGQGIPFDTLFFKSPVPPRQIYAAHAGRANRRVARGSPLKPEPRKKKVAKPSGAGRRGCCRSADLSFTEESHKKFADVRSQASVLRSLQTRIQQCIAKYEAMRNNSVSCEDLFKDINELRNFL